jgi:hypothetical protein
MSLHSFELKKVVDILSITIETDDLIKRPYGRAHPASRLRKIGNCHVDRTHGGRLMIEAWNKD